jgi:hypothetical protein
MGKNGLVDTSTKPFSFQQFVSEIPILMSTRSTMNVKEFDNFVFACSTGNGWLSRNEISKTPN